MTPMQKPVCHLDMCRALHNLHRATLHGTWNFQPLSIDLKRPNAKPVSFVYLEERLYLFREGNTYRMAYGSNPIEAYYIAYQEEEKKAEEQRTDAASKPWYFYSHTRFGYWCEKHFYRTRKDAIKARQEFRDNGLQATAIYDARKEAKR